MSSAPVRFVVRVLTTLSALTAGVRFPDRVPTPARLAKVTAVFFCKSLIEFYKSFLYDTKILGISFVYHNYNTNKSKSQGVNLDFEDYSSFFFLRSVKPPRAVITVPTIPKIPDESPVFGNALGRTFDADFSSSALS